MQNQQQQKTAHLFYSAGFCEHSKRCLERIGKLGLSNLINLWNIDNPAINIPPFIQSVPTIYLADERRVLTNRELFEWIESNAKQSSNNNTIQTMASITGSDNICAWSAGEIGGGAGFAFIDDNQNQMLDSQFEFLDGSNGKDKLKMAQITRVGDGDLGNIPGQETDTQIGGGGGSSRSNNRSSETDKAYQRMMEERNSEMKNNPLAMRR